MNLQVARAESCLASRAASSLEELAPEPQASYYRARYYDPAVGRFLSEDPIQFNAGGNFYNYVRGNPVLLADPSGRCAICIAAALGALTDVGTQLLFNGFRPRCIDWIEVVVSAAVPAIGVGIGQKFGTINKGLNRGPATPSRPTCRFLKIKGILRIEAHPPGGEYPDWFSYPHFHPDFIPDGAQPIHHWPLVEPLVGIGSRVYHFLKGTNDCECDGNQQGNDFPLPMPNYIEN